MNNERVDYPLDEFVSFEVHENKAKSHFVITIQGDIKYKSMIADKIGSLVFSEDDLKKWKFDE